MKIFHRAFDSFMSQKFLNHNNGNAIFQQMRSKAVSKRMRMNFFADSRLFANRFYHPLYAALTVSGIKIFLLDISIILISIK